MHHADKGKEVKAEGFWSSLDLCRTGLSSSYLTSTVQYTVSQHTRESGYRPLECKHPMPNAPRPCLVISSLSYPKEELVSRQFRCPRPDGTRKAELDAFVLLSPWQTVYSFFSAAKLSKCPYLGGGQGYSVEVSTTWKLS